eukprot:CAMPEP_0204573200 /NCGR_PEP_ID=MMETSP0661-20131031/39880_1 /ASSEMBLY_ACC=CAM_ASM_000606 /TAXON_ID=109239 /ORGANISM="Alexandrium margalefi, Strain AMGDE01CS-322" /LENGTH=287 /DNA_ID=CAMNT_0051581599 /DNA_START=30 /DNA_END=893 /DNA_ORIENTATION=+
MSAGGGVLDPLHVACELMQATVRAGGSRHTVAAVAAALWRCALSTHTKDDVDGSEAEGQVALRLSAICPVRLAQERDARSSGVSSHSARGLVSTAVNRRANLARQHHEFGTDFAQLTDSAGRRAQRGQRPAARGGAPPSPVGPACQGFFIGDAGQEAGATATASADPSADSSTYLGTDLGTDLERTTDDKTDEKDEKDEKDEMYDMDKDDPLAVIRAFVAKYGSAKAEIQDDGGKKMDDPSLPKPNGMVQCDSFKNCEGISYVIDNVKAKSHHKKEKRNKKSVGWTC